MNFYGCVKILARDEGSVSVRVERGAVLVRGHLPEHGPGDRRHPAGFRGPRLGRGAGGVPGVGGGPALGDGGQGPLVDGVQRLDHGPGGFSPGLGFGIQCLGAPLARHR